MHTTEAKQRARIVAPDAYRVLVLRRVRLAGELLTVGQTVVTPTLGLALRLVGCGFGIPADARTRLDVDLGLALRRAIPRR